MIFLQLQVGQEYATTSFIYRGSDTLGHPVIGLITPVASVFLSLLSEVKHKHRVPPPHQREQGMNRLEPFIATKRGFPNPGLPPNMSQDADTLIGELRKREHAVQHYQVDLLLSGSLRRLILLPPDMS